MKKFLLTFIVLLFTAMPAYAGDTTTLTLTEADINAVLNGVVTNVEQIEALDVDFEEDAVTISATATTEDGETVTTSVSLAAVAQQDGEGYYWEVKGAMVNGRPVPQRTIDEVNTMIQSSEFHELRTSAEDNILVSVSISEDSITYKLNDNLGESIDNLPGEFEVPSERPGDVELPGAFNPEEFTPPSDAPRGGAARENNDDQERERPSRRQ